MMRRIGQAFLSLLTCCILFSACASPGPVDLNPQIKSGKLVQKTRNFIVLFDNSASMTYLHDGPFLNQTPRLTHAQDAMKSMIATLPEIQLNAGLRLFWAEETTLIYGMKSLVKEDYIHAINSIRRPDLRSPIGLAITAAGNDLRSAEGHSAIIIVSDFSDLPGTDDMHVKTIMDAITKVNAEYGDKLCVYAIQVGYTFLGKELSEKIVRNVRGGYNINADRLVTPQAMAAFVERVISGNCSRYPQVVPIAKEKVVIVATEPMVENKVVAALSETKAKEKVVVFALEDVHFERDESTLTPEAKTILKRNIQVLKDNPKTKVRIAGYSSGSGSDVHNQKLSERRADAVRGYLISEGFITRDRLSTIGYGETNPLMYEAAPNEIYSEAAKANMRVLFEVILE